MRQNKSTELLTISSPYIHDEKKPNMAIMFPIFFLWFSDDSPWTKYWFKRGQTCRALPQRQSTRSPGTPGIPLGLALCSAAHQLGITMWELANKHPPPGVRTKIRQDGHPWPFIAKRYINKVLLNIFIYQYIKINIPSTYDITSRSPTAPPHTPPTQ